MTQDRAINIATLITRLAGAKVTPDTIAIMQAR